jgi:transposase InsO family protein
LGAGFFFVMGPTSPRTCLRRNRITISTQSMSPHLSAETWQNRCPVHANADDSAKALGRLRIASRKAELFDYVELFYNQQRRHSSLSYASPAEHERALQAAA